MKKLVMLGFLVLAGCMSGGDRPLQLVSGSGAPYPAQARSDGIEGYVVVRYDVDETGRVTNLSVAESEPPGVFDEAALKAVAAWRYNPPISDGQPRPVRGVSSRVDFKLGDGGDYREY
jgi:protein TonB